MNSNYARAYTEVLEIIKYFPEDEYNKISKEKIEFYEANMDKEYNFSIDSTIDLADQNISKEANAIIITLFNDYFATEEQKIKIQEILVLNQRKLEIEKSKKYNPNDLFKNKKTDRIVSENQESNIEETSLVEYKENFFIKFKNFILKLLHIK